MSTALDTPPHPIDITVGARITSQRLSNGMTQSDLATAIGVSFQQVQKYEKGSNRISAHSQAAALDFAGVRLRDGRRITVTKDWNGDTPEARFLRRIRDDACRIFGTTLSPDYNAVHADHLHLEATDTRFCR